MPAGALSWVCQVFTALSVLYKSWTLVQVVICVMLYLPVLPGCPVNLSCPACMLLGNTAPSHYQPFVDPLSKMYLDIVFASHGLFIRLLALRPM